MRVSKFIVLFSCAFTLCACQSKPNPPSSDYERPKIEKSDSSINEKEPIEKTDEDKPVESTEEVGKYKIKLKTPTKLLQGSIDITEEENDFFHMDTGLDGFPSIFQSELFEPHNLLVLEIRHPGDSFEYLIIPLTGEKLKVEKSFKTFYSPPTVEKGASDGEFVFTFQEPYPDSAGARTVAPYVVVNYKNGKMTLDGKAMKEHADSSDFGSVETIKDAFEVHQYTDSLPPEFVEEIVGRYYVGKAKEARKLFDQAWPKKRKGKEESWNEIIGQMKKSPYWPEIKAMNKL